MDMYERVREAYERAARVAEEARQEDERRNAEEWARQRRETELRRQASVVACALVSHGAQGAGDPFRSWPLYQETDGLTIAEQYDLRSWHGYPSPYPPAHPPKVYLYELGENGELYLNGALVSGLTHATMDELERGLADLVVWYRLDPELFRTKAR
jgi:hypothetical protein